MGNLFWNKATLKSVREEEGSYYTKICTLYINKAGFYNIRIILSSTFSISKKGLLKHPVKGAPGKLAD
jgi:hypothetical protein